MKTNSIVIAAVVGSIIAGAMVVGIVIGAMVVRSEGEKTRESIREVAAQPKIPTSLQTGVDASVEQANKQASRAMGAVERAESALDDLFNKTLDPKPRTDKPESSSTGQSGKPSSGPSLPRDKPKDAKPSSDKSAGDQGPGTSDADSQARPGPLERAAQTLWSLPEKAQSTLGEGRMPGNPDDLVDQAFDAAGKAGRTADEAGQKMFKIPPEEEAEWGRKLHEQLLTEVKPVKDSKQLARIRRLAEPVLAARRRKIEYTFTILDDDEVNAFSLAGGYVYVNRGLLKLAAKDVELQSVLGHEIGHVDLEHCVKRLGYSTKAAKVFTPIGADVLKVLRGVLARTFTQQEEYEADQYSFRAMLAIGRSRDDAVSFLEHLQRWEGDAKPAEQQDGLTETLARAGSHFGTHPPTEKRIERLRGLKP